MNLPNRVTLAKPLISFFLVVSLNQNTVFAEQATTQLPDPLAAGWNKKQVCEKLHEDKNQRILRCTFAPGVGHEKHFHVAHFGYALSGGTMRIVDATGTREVTLKTGSNYTSNGTEWHHVLNIGDTTVRYLIVEIRTSQP